MHFACRRGLVKAKTRRRLSLEGPQVAKLGKSFPLTPWGTAASQRQQQPGSVSSTRFSRSLARSHTPNSPTPDWVTATVHGATYKPAWGGGRRRRCSAPCPGLGSGSVSPLPRSLARSPSFSSLCRRRDMIRLPAPRCEGPQSAVGAPQRRLGEGVGPPQSSRLITSEQLPAARSRACRRPPRRRPPAEIPSKQRARRPPPSGPLAGSFRWAAAKGRICRP